MHELLGVVALSLIPGLPLTFIWTRFLRQSRLGQSRSFLTLEFPLAVVTGSYVLFVTILGFTFWFLRAPFGSETHIQAVIWLNVGVSFAMSVLAFAGKHSLRWKLAASAAAVFLVWLVVGLSILAVEAASEWVL
jgi:hypothetical protein